MVDKIEGAPSPQESYRNSYDRAVNLFQQSLAAYEKSTEPHQKEKFKDVMDKCLVIIHETIRSVKGTEQPLKKVDQDYENFIANDNPKTLGQLQKGIDSLKNG